MIDCPECKGTGYVLSVDTMPCAACDHTGRILDGKCVCCNGGGSQLVEVKVLCPQCGGRGKAIQPTFGQGSGI
jgi:hypothetical protein